MARRVLIVQERVEFLLTTESFVPDEAMTARLSQRDQSALDRSGVPFPRRILNRVDFGICAKVDSVMQKARQACRKSVAKWSRDR